MSEQLQAELKRFKQLEAAWRLRANVRKSGQKLWSAMNQEERERQR